MKPWTVTIPDDGDAIVWAESAEEAAAQVGTGLGLKLVAVPAEPVAVAYSVVNGDGMERALADVIVERERQRLKWGDDHDDEHDSGEIALAAALLAHPTELISGAPEWALVLADRVSDDRRRELVIAGALILAEIERLDRGAARG